MDHLIRVLHVDDDPDFAALVATYLEREDDRIEVTTAAGAGEGLDVLASDPVDCVVSDYDMPGTDGIEFLEAVREDHPDLPFILYTGKGSEAVASDAISAGVTDYLQKGGGTSQYTVLANRIANAVEQYRSQRALDESQERLSLFFEQSPLGVVEWNEDFEFVRLNDAAEEVLGYSTTDLRGDSWERIVPGTDREAVDEVVTELLDARGGYHSVNENVRKDGERIVCEWHNRVVTDDAGEVVAVFSQFREVTEEYRRRQRREHQREALVELASDEAVTAGDFGPALRRITETAADVLDVRRVSVWLFEDGRLRCVNGYDRAEDSHDRGTVLATGNYPSYVEALETHRVVDADDAAADPRTGELAGDYFEEHGIGAVVDAALRSEGEVVGVVCHEHVGGPREWTDDEVDFAGDVADVVHRALRNRQRAERQRKLEFRQSLLEAQQESVLDGQLVVDESGEVVSYNDRFVELWEVPRAVVEEGDDGELLEWATEQVDDPGAFRQQVEYLNDNPEETGRAEIRLADGRVLDRYTTPVTGEDGTYYGRLWTFRDITERKDREERLRRTSARLEALFENSPDMINVHDTDGNLLDPNPRIQAETGYDAAELTEMKVWDVDRTVDPAEARATWAAMETGETYRSEGEYVRRDGSTFPVEVHVRRLDLEGKDRFLAISRDVSERKERQRELERYETIVETIDDVAVVVDGDWTVAYVSDAIREYGEFSPDDLEGRSVTALANRFLVEESDADAFVRTLDRTFDAEGANPSPERIELSLDVGEVVTFEYQFSPIVEGGETTAVVVTMRDVTERKARERDLAETKERLDTVVSNVPMILFALDPDGTIVLSEGRGLEALGLEPGETVGESVLDLYGDHPELRSTIERALAGEALSTVQEYNDLYFETAYQPVFDDDGELTRVIGVSMDVTERKQRQEELRRQNERLEEFASVVSHDLRNPLEIANGGLELARQDCDSEYLDNVERAIDRMEVLTEDLLTLARQGERISDFEPVDLGAIVEECWLTVETGEAELDVDADLTVRADPNRLRELVENLLGNAVEHGSAGGRPPAGDVVEHGSTGDRRGADPAAGHRDAAPTITVGTLDDGFYVADDGPGIPEEERDRIFESGYSTLEDGTGFGLSIVADIAEAHGWEVRATESAEGGARFEITGVEFVE